MEDGALCYPSIKIVIIIILLNIYIYGSEIFFFF